MRSAHTLCVAAGVIWAALPAPGQDKPAPGALMRPDAPSAPSGKGKKQDHTAILKKADLKFVEDSREPRDVIAAAAVIDRWVDAGLNTARVAASSLADDAQFFRRVTLDIIGRIPTYEEAVTFLESADLDKRSRWINELLASSLYGEHFATIWREAISPSEGGVKKPARDSFSPWLAEQFNRNRGWDQIVREMLTAEGRIRETPQSGFILANSENQEPQPNLLADATGRLFWGVQLRCAECHDHPFAPWKQADFWGTAAFFQPVAQGLHRGQEPKWVDPDGGAAGRTRQQVVYKTMGGTGCRTRCPGHQPSRRELLKLLAAGVGGVSLSRWLGPLAASAAQRQPPSARQKSCILLWMDGGPSHVETFDPKPEAPAEIRGDLGAIGTSVAGIQVGEKFPRVAGLMQHGAIVRSMSTGEADHGRARIYVHTGYRPGAGGIIYPGLGSTVSAELLRPDSPLPNFVVTGEPLTKHDVVRDPAIAGRAISRWCSPT